MSSRPSYYPSGWDYERVLNASSDDIVVLGDDQKTSMFDGLKASLGPDGFEATIKEMN